MILENATRKDYRQIKRLFISAFPKEERPPFYALKRKLKTGEAKMYVAKDNGNFIGFIHLVCFKDLIYLFFFAIQDEFRGKGYGSKVIKTLIAQNPDKRIFLAREPLDDTADNNAQRISRRQFYMRNGFTDLPLKIVEGGYVFDSMGVNCKISAKDYNDVTLNWAGKRLHRLVNFHAIEQ